MPTPAGHYQTRLFLYTAMRTLRPQLSNRPRGRDRRATKVHTAPTAPPNGVRCPRQALQAILCHWSRLLRPQSRALRRAPCRPRIVAAVPEATSRPCTVGENRPSHASNVRIVAESSIMSRTSRLSRRYRKTGTPSGRCQLLHLSRASARRHLHMYRVLYGNRSAWHTSLSVTRSKSDRNGQLGLHRPDRASPDTHLASGAFPARLESLQRVQSLLYCPNRHLSRIWRAQVENGKRPSVILRMSSEWSHRAMTSRASRVADEIWTKLVKVYLPLTPQRRRWSRPARAGPDRVCSTLEGRLRAYLSSRASTAPSRLLR